MSLLSFLVLALLCGVCCATIVDPCHNYECHLGDVCKVIYGKLGNPTATCVPIDKPGYCHVSSVLAIRCGHGRPCYRDSDCPGIQKCCGRCSTCQNPTFHPKKG
ncbi:perlwapin-like [Haliotis cracherodii]|uniref:perlwapin-like n=1 Tax=Haliotis cracherodii TaxID=6455 RepID=UPI0039E807D9